MNEFQFKPEIAEKYGVNEAIFLHSLSFWVIKNWSNNQNFHNGKFWSYDTYKDIAKRFSFWTARQVERIVASCEAQGAVLVGNFNEDKTKRTKWYTLSGDAERIYLSEMVRCISPDGEMLEPQGVAPEQAADGPISPNGEMQFTKAGHPSHQTVKSIEVTVTNQLENPHSPQKKRKEILSPDARQLLNEYVGTDHELAEELITLIEIREEKKAVNSFRAIRSLLKELDRLSGGDRDSKILLLRQASANSWKSVFPVRSIGTANGNDRPERGKRIVI